MPRRVYPKRPPQDDEISTWLEEFIPFREREELLSESKVGTLPGDDQRYLEYQDLGRPSLTEQIGKRREFLGQYGSDYPKPSKPYGFKEKVLEPIGQGIVDTAKDMTNIGANLLFRGQVPTLGEVFGQRPSSKTKTPAPSVPAGPVSSKTPTLPSVREVPLDLPSLEPQPTTPINAPPRPDKPTIASKPATVAGTPELVPYGRQADGTPGTDIRIRKRTKLNPEDEDHFKAWYDKTAKELGINQNPDDPNHKYDYRAFWRSGGQVGPDQHFDSKFKDDDHPNRFVLEGGQILDTKYGKPVPSSLFTKLATPKQKAQLEQHMVAAGQSFEGPVQPAVPDIFTALPGMAEQHNLNQQAQAKQLMEMQRPGATSPTAGIPSMVQDKPFTDDAREVGRQIVGGAVVDLPKMTGQAIQAFSPKDSKVHKMGKELAAAAKLREAGWEPDLEGRGSIADAFIRGGRGIAPSVSTIAAYLNPYGAVTGPLATVALFGGSQFQEEYDKIKAAGGTEQDATNAGLITGLIQGGGEVAANYLQLKMLGAGKKLAKGQINRMLKSATESGTVKPWLKATTGALAGEAATEIGQDMGTAAVERAYGLETQSFPDIAYESGTAALGMTALLAPFGLSGHYRNSNRAKAIETILTDPAAASKQERETVVKMLHDEAAGLKIEEADAWLKGALEDVKKGDPIRRSVDGAQEEQAPSQSPTAQPTPESVSPVTSPGLPPDLGEVQPQAGKFKAPKVGDIVNRKVQEIADQFPMPSLDVKTGAQPKLIKKGQATPAEAPPIEPPIQQVAPTPDLAPTTERPETPKRAPVPPPVALGEDMREALDADLDLLDETPTQKPGRAEAPTVQELHAMAESKGIESDNDPAFQDFTEHVTGKQHLDSLTPPERALMAEAIDEQPAGSELATTMPAVAEAPALTPVQEQPNESRTQDLEDRVAQLEELPLDPVARKQNEKIIEAQEGRLLRTPAGRFQMQRPDGTFLVNPATGGNEFRTEAKAREVYEKTIDVAPAPELTPPSKPVEKAEVTELVGDANFKEGEKVSFERNGKKLTGVVKGYFGDELDIQVDQIAKPGGVPLLRREVVKVTNPTLQRLDTKGVFKDGAAEKPAAPPDLTPAVQSTSRPANKKETAPKKVSPKDKKKLSGKQMDEKRRAYFSPGNIVTGYGGRKDVVVAYRPGNTPYDWSVDVREVLPSGELGPVRNHSTHPTMKEMERFDADPTRRTLEQAGKPVDIDPAPARQKQKPVSTPVKAVEKPVAKPEPKADTPSKYALDTIDKMYRSILDDTKVVHHLRKGNKEAWATVKRVDANMKASQKAGMDYDEAAAQVPMEDLDKLSEIIESAKAPTQAESLTSVGAPERITELGAPDRTIATPSSELADLFKQESEQAKKSKVTKQPRIPVDPITGGKPVSLSEIILNLEQGVGKKLTVGKTKRGTAGTYKPGSTATVIKYSGDLDATAHELSHALDDKFGLVKDWKGQNTSPFDAELKPFSVHGSSGTNTSPTYDRAEGVAEYMRAWMVNPTAAESAAPQFTAHMKAKLPPQIQTALKTFSDHVRSWAGNSAHAKIMANVQWETPETGLTHWITGGKTAKGPGFKLTFGDQLADVWTDDLSPFMRALKYVKEQRGTEDLKPGEDPALLARLYMGENAKVDDVLAHGMVDSQLNRATPGGLTWLLEPLDSTSSKTIHDDMQEVASLMIAQRTLEKAEQLGKARVSGIGAGIESDMTVAEARLAELKQNPQRYARLKEAASRYRQWADANLRYLVDKGRLSQEQYETIKARNEYYVAMQRLIEVSPGEELSIHVPQGSGKTIGSVKQPIKEFKGSTRTIKNPYHALMDATNHALREADRNEIMKLFRDLLTVERGMYEGEPTDLASVGRQAQTGEKETIPIYVNGKKEVWQFHPDVYRALKGLNEHYTLPGFLTILPKVLRSTIVNAPPFALRNVIRDSWHRAVNSLSGSKPWDTLNVYSKEEISQLKKSGGDQAGHYYSDAKSYARAMQYAIEEAVQSKNSIVVDPSKLWAWAKKGGQGYLDLMQGSERQGRLSEYRRAFRKAQEKFGYDDYHAMLYAAGQSRGLIDYAVAGRWMRVVNQLVPFSNAAVQGLRSTALRAKADPTGYALRFGAFALMPTLMTYAWNTLYGDGDDAEEYRQLPAYQRDLFWNFKFGPDLWLKIPKPFEIGVLATTVERTLDYAMGNEKAFDGHVGAFARTLLPVDEASLAGPYQAIFQASANYDFFRDRPIVPRWEENLDLELRSYNRASRLGQALQQAVGVDARKIDFVINQQFGYLGRYAADLSDAGRKDRHGLTISSIGMTSSSPSSVSLDAKKVAQIAEERGLVPSRAKAVDRLAHVKEVRNGSYKNPDAVRYAVFRKHLNQYYKAESNEERDQAARLVRDEARLLRERWEKTPPRQEAEEKAGTKRAERTNDPLLNALGLGFTPPSKSSTRRLPALTP